MSDLASGNRGKARLRRRLPPEDRRRTLVAAASQLFAERGYDHVTLDEVAGQAGVTKVIVYRHFGSKKALYLELLALHRDELLRTLVPGMGGTVPLQRRVRAVAEAWFAYVEMHPFAWAMLFRDTTGDREIRTFHESMRATARDAILALLRAEQGLALDREVREPVAEVLRSAMTGLALWWLDHRDIERQTLVDAIVHTIWRGLASAAVDG